MKSGLHGEKPIHTPLSASRHQGKGLRFTGTLSASSCAPLLTPSFGFIFYGQRVSNDPPSSPPPPSHSCTSLDWLARPVGINHTSQLPVPGCVTGALAWLLSLLANYLEETTGCRNQLFPCCQRLWRTQYWQTHAQLECRGVRATPRVENPFKRQLFTTT